MEYLNNLLNSNTQSGGVYAVSMHQLNQILQLSSAYFNSFNDKIKQDYIKLFGFTPVSLLKGGSSSKMPQYRERFIFLIYLQFCILLMMNKTAGMDKNETLKYLGELCKKFNISGDNKICKNIKDALTGSTSTDSTSTGSTKDYNIDDAFDFILSKLDDNEKKLVKKRLERLNAERNQNGGNINKFLLETYPYQYENIKKIFEIGEAIMLIPDKNFKLNFIFITFIDIEELDKVDDDDEDKSTQFMKENINKYIIQEKVLRIKNNELIFKLDDNLNINLLKQNLQILEARFKAEEEEKAKAKAEAEEEAILKANEEADIKKDYDYLRTNRNTQSSLFKNTESEYYTLHSSNKEGEGEGEEKTMDLHPEVVDNKEEELKKKIIQSQDAITLSTEQTNKMNNILQNFKNLDIEEKKIIIKTMSDNETSNKDKINKILEEVEIYEDDFDGGSYNNIDITNTLQDIF